MILKWVVAVLAVTGALVVAGPAGYMAALILEFLPASGAGFCAAFAVVVVAYIAAPSHKFTFALVVLAIGAVAAWVILVPSYYYPESYGSGPYPTTPLPIIFTYVGGIAGLAVAGILRRQAGA